jgi:hypothetical protein
MGVRIPAGTVEQQLRAALREGRTPEQATAAVLGPYAAVLAEAGNDSLAGYSRPAVLAAARRLHRQMTRRAEDRAFSAAPGTRDRLRLGGLEFHMPDGTVVSWADATAGQHEARVAWLQTYIGSLETDVRRHERAAKLLAERGAERLADIDGWEALVGDELDDEDAGGGDDAGGGVVP